MKIKNTQQISGLLIAMLVSSVSYGSTLDKTNVSFSGYIKADAMFSSYQNGTLGSANLGRDFYVPSLTPVGSTEEDTQYDSHMKQTRFRFTTNTELSNNQKITGVIEFDFQATPNGNERITNSYEPRVRHAFIKYQSWTIGQTWSTFQDVGALPESVDFIGTTDGTIFDRQVMIRYRYDNFEFALENPETTVTPFGGGARIVTDDNTLPDAVVRYTHKSDWGHLALAGLLRQLTYIDGDAIDSTESSYGLSLTGKILLGKDDVRFMLNTGRGLGRYIGLNTANGAVLDADGELQAIDSSGISLAYRHVWSEQWRSNLMYSAFSADNNTALTGTAVTKTTYSTRVNLMYSPSKELTFGGELSYAKREIESGLKGDFNRLQFTAKYAF